MSEELKLLNDLLDSDKLTEEQSEAFAKMREGLETGKFKKLTPRQRDWVDDVHTKLGLNLETANLVSSGQVKVTEKERQDLQVFVKSLGPKHLRPPNKRNSGV